MLLRSKEAGEVGLLACSAAIQPVRCGRSAYEDMTPLPQVNTFYRRQC